MKQFCFATLVVALSAVGAACQQDAQKEKKSLEGVWTATAYEQSGKKAEGARARLLDGMSWEFKGDEAIWRMEGKVELQATCKIAPGKTPKEIDLFDTKRKSNYVGIYQVDGDTLKIRFHFDKDARPKEFTTEPGTRGHFLLVLKRSKK